ncbi:tyrosine-type recombinase/integrase [Chromobacterium piscinae]|uniref:site-specific integrase n=1 Tax=Chromobacterium piscinae TaxID=686831 RepID=UPI001E6262A2|nr:site-specific integrase [Chromobacterium piscinae]MCD4505770.1 tyrosine-type recombinase/integrase [Chromobacterium piscinae]
MSKSVKEFVEMSEKCSLPLISVTRSGIKFYPHEMIWAFRDSNFLVHMNFNFLSNKCPVIITGLKKVMIWYLANRSPRTCSNNFHIFLWLVRQLGLKGNNSIEIIELKSIVDVLYSSDQAQYNLASIRGFLVRWYKLGVPGIEEDLVCFLTHKIIKQSPVGVAVATLDSEKGPLTDFEFESIQLALNNAYIQGEISVERLLLCYLLMALGARPEQLAALKCCDLIVPEGMSGDYVIKVPRVKQRGMLLRSEFKWRKLTPQLGELLAAYVKDIQRKFQDRLKEVSEAPMFPSKWGKSCACTVGYEFHSTASSISYKVTSTFEKINALSSEVNKKIPVQAIRLRRTFATRAAEEGWPLLVIAELLDHTTTRHAAIYTGVTSRIRAQFSRKIAMDMAPLAMIFSGKVIRNEGEASRPQATSRVIDLRIDSSGASMGSCGSHAHCEFSRPFACYAGCYNFEPWLDGPHEAALDYMLNRRAQLMERTDARIASINDRAILGCAQIILRCRQIKKDAS